MPNEKSTHCTILARAKYQGIVPDSLIDLKQNEDSSGRISRRALIFSKFSDFPRLLPKQDGVGENMQIDRGIDAHLNAGEFIPAKTQRYRKSVRAPLPLPSSFSPSMLSPPIDALAH